jgi:hypothetical protein
MSTTVITPDALELMTQLNEVAKGLLEAAKALKEELPPREVEAVLYTPEQAAKYTGIAVQTLATYRQTGQIGDRTPAPGFIKVGKSVFYEKAELDRWIREDAPKFHYRRQTA